MKRIIRHYAILTFSLWTASRIASGIVFDGGIETIFLAGLGFMGASLLAKPVINILLLPINLITFGVFRWVASAVVLYLVTLIVPGFSVVRFNFTGLSTKWIDIPSMDFGGVIAYVAFAFVISFLSSLIFWLRK